MRPALVSYFLRRVRDPSEAEDLAHEVFIRLAGAPLESLRSTDAYVFQVAANLLCDRARRNKVREDYAHSVAGRSPPVRGAWIETRSYRAPQRACSCRNAIPENNPCAPRPAR